nr:MAG TPA: hypothetical protein [Caudoviricetes sp.]
MRSYKFAFCACTIFKDILTHIHKYFIRVTHAIYSVSFC